MPELIVCVGDIFEELSQYARLLSPDAYHIDQQNQNHHGSGVAYTSLGDFNTIYDLLNALKRSTSLIYVPSESWSDQALAYEFQSLEKSTLIALHICRNVFGIPVKNLPELPTLLQSPVDRRRVETPQMWISGCSVSHGIGVSNDQRYGAILESATNLPVSYLTIPGASNDWAADQILSSDVRSGDIVVWGLTDCTRYQLYKDWSHHHVTTTSYQKIKDLQQLISIEMLGSQQIFFHDLSKIKQVKNFCDSRQARLILVEIQCSIEMCAYLSTELDFVTVYGFANDPVASFLDFGTDQRHPGPLTHQLYASKILEKLNQNRESITQ